MVEVTFKEKHCKAHEKLYSKGEGVCELCGLSCFDLFQWKLKAHEETGCEHYGSCVSGGDESPSWHNAIKLLER